MVTIETLQMINADLDAERDERLQIIRNADRGARLRNDFVEGDNMEDLGPSASTVATLAEEEDEQEKTKPEDSEHMKTFKEFVEFYELLGSLVSAKVIYNWRWYSKKLFWIGVSALLITWICMLYTAFTHLRNNDYLRIFEPLVVSGLVISSTQKLHGFIKYWNEMVALFFFLRSTGRRTTNGSSRGNILTTGFRKTLRFIKVFVVGVFLSIIFYLVIPVKFYIVDNELMSLIPMIEVLFCDQSTMSGFLSANVVQAVIGFYAAWVTMLYGATFINFIFTYRLSVDLVAEDFKDLDRMWTGEVQVTLAYKHAFLKNICKKRQDMNNYLDTIRTIYTTKLFFYFCFNYFSQILGMYQTIINHWQGGYGLFLGLLFEAMFYCFMGTQISIADDRLCAVIYDTKWYEYDQTSQKVIYLILMEAQMSRDIQLGFIGPLNLVTFITIYKSIYSYYTVLTEMMV